MFDSEVLERGASIPLAPRDDRPPPKFKYRLLNQLSDVLKPKAWLIKNVIALGETSAWIAPPGGMKSALLGELAFAVATKTDWHGYRAKSGGAVVYFALERADLVERRLRAYRARSGGVDAPIAVVPAMVDLMNRGTVNDVIAAVRGVQRDTGQTVAMIVFDTFAKLIAAGGGDEDKAKDQGAVFANVQRVKDAIGCHVALVGHTGKDETRGSRGSNAILGDVDVMVTISGDAVKTVTVTKANDAPEGPLFHFKSDIHDFGADEDGDPVTVNIVSADDVSAPAHNSAAPKLTANEKTMFTLLHDAGASGLLTEEWDAKGKDAGIGDRRRADRTDARTGLKKKGFVREFANRWTVNHRS